MSKDEEVLMKQILKENAEWFRDATRQLVSSKRIIKIKRIFKMEYVEIKRLKELK